MTKSRFQSVIAVSMVFLVIALSLVTWARGADADIPVVSTERLKTMMDEKQTFVLVDTRTAEEFQEAHIKGAISIPEKTFDEKRFLLPGDRSVLIVLYCNGVKCGKSKKAAKKAEAAGYRNLQIYAEGFPVWEEKGLAIVAGPEYGTKIETTKIKPAELQVLIDGRSSDIVVVDVRDESEFKEGHIPSAVNIPVETFALRSEVLPKEKKIIVYCNTGGRSYSAYRKLMKLAYPSIFQAMFADWKEAGMPVEKQEVRDHAVR